MDDAFQVERLRQRLNALIQACIREEKLVQGLPMTRVEIMTEIRAIAATRDTVKTIAEQQEEWMPFRRELVSRAQ